MIEMIIAKVGFFKSHLGKISIDFPITNQN